MRIKLLFILIFTSISVLSQNVKKIKILNTDNTFINKKNHPEYWRLVGNVSFNHNNTLMTCDSAYHYSKTNKIVAFSNVNINKSDTLNLSGDKLYYDANSKYAKVVGNVKLENNQNKLYTNQVNYDMNEDILYYDSFGEIIDKNQRITSKKGVYQINEKNYIFRDSVIVFGDNYTIYTQKMTYKSIVKENIMNGPSKIILKSNIIYCENGIFNSKNNLAYFSDNAQIISKNNTIKADSIFYNKTNNYAKAINNVIIIDTINNFKVIGGQAELFEDEDKTIISKNPILYFPFEQDTLFMKGDKFVHTNTNNKKIIQLFNNVEIFKENFSGKCDSLSYSLSDSLIKMYKKPLMWIDDYQISSDSIEFLFFDETINKIFMNSNPIMISQIDSLDFNQIKGKKMTAFMKKNQIKFINVIGNGESIYYLKDKKNKIGLNYIQSSNLILHFNDKKLNNVIYKNMPISVTTPYNDIIESQRFLKDFNWKVKEKPSKFNTTEQ